MFRATELYSFWRVAIRVGTAGMLVLQAGPVHIQPQITSSDYAIGKAKTHGQLISIGLNAQSTKISPSEETE